MTAASGSHKKTKLDEYDSAFECDSEVESKRQKRTDLAYESYGSSEQQARVPVSKQFFAEEKNKTEAALRKHEFLSLDAYTRHKKLVNEYILCYSGQTKLLQRDRSKDKSEKDMLKENHKFLWNDDDDVSSWEKRLAKKYYDKLFKEYCICDLSRFKENKVAMRWRTETEVVNGKGQFSCGEKHCPEETGLKSWEVNFAYIEESARKNALVKLRLCPECSFKLNYKQKRKEIKSWQKLAEKNPAEEVVKLDKQSEESVSEQVEVNKTPKDNSEIWKEPLKIAEEKSRDEEFEEYLADMLL